MSLLFAALPVSPIEGQGLPDEIPQLDWTSAARALDEDYLDSVRPYSRNLIDEQSAKFRAAFGSAAAHGLREGRLPPREFFTVKGIGSEISFLGPAASLLISGNTDVW